ncbi:MAG: hypothetical protein JXM73_04635 [Anaerolineae bacterium]|nr:hypothetical protein [Anaerolineae bacterium]
MTISCPLVFDAEPAEDGTPRKRIRFEPSQVEVAHQFTVLLTTIIGVPLEALPTQPVEEHLARFYPFEFYLLLTAEVRQALEVLAAVVTRLQQPTQGEER